MKDEEIAMKNLVEARVIKVFRGKYVVSVENREVNAVLSGKLKYQEAYPVIGDYLKVELADENEGVICEILPRKSYLSRPDGSGHSDNFVKTYGEQAMVANLDYLFIVTSLNDDFNVNRIARFTATSIKGGCKPVIILTKADLCPDKEAFLAKVKETTKNIDAFCISSYTGEGIDRVREYLSEGVTIGLMGSSGVGKSTLINTLAGKEVMKVSSIRDKDDKGRHTTTHREMINVSGTYFVDTPGMREFGLCDVEEGINETFDDIAGLLGCCKFSNCRHDSEPGCAIKRAIEDGSLTKERWELYCSLMNESNKSRDMSLKKKIALQKKKLGKKGEM